MLRQPIDVDADGCLVLADRPGLGIELDEEKLRATRVA
jgi:L-alanine-DL-glutamate epimerase-like enolase superfamily enzyme